MEQLDLNKLKKIHEIQKLKAEIQKYAFEEIVYTVKIDQLKNPEKYGYKDREQENSRKEGDVGKDTN